MDYTYKNNMRKFCCRIREFTMKKMICLVLLIATLFSLAACSEFKKGFEEGKKQVEISK